MGEIEVRFWELAELAGRHRAVAADYTAMAAATVSRADGELETAVALDRLERRFRAVIGELADAHARVGHMLACCADAYQDLERS